MKHLPNLHWLERLALWLLVRSPRTSLVVVKELPSAAIFVAADPRDEVAAYVTDGQIEPPSMLLERLYHAPAYGEPE